MKPIACTGPKKSPTVDGRPFGKFPQVVAKTSDAATSVSTGAPASGVGMVHVVSPDGGNMKPLPVTGFVWTRGASGWSVSTALIAVHDPVPIQTTVIGLAGST